MIYRNMLITGAGGDIALALAEIARGSGAAARLIGVDARSGHAGHGAYDDLAVLPRADAPDYFDRLADVVRRHRPDIIVPTSEAELQALAGSDALEAFEGVPVLAANREAIETGLDKLATARRLAACGLAVPWTRIVGEEPPLALPCIIKQRRGQGSKGVAVVQSEAQAEAWSRDRAGDVWQQLLPDAEQEYTCGLYMTRRGELRTVSFRRTLQGGLTGFAETVFDPRIDAVLAEVANALQLRGAINVQLRLLDGQPMIFEINPRFSSTVGFRHSVGFRDFVWALLESRGMAIEDYAPPPVRMCFYRVGRLVSFPA